LISSAIATVHRLGSPNFGMLAAILRAAALAIAPTSALAEVQVRGSSEAVTIEAHDTSVEEVLAVLSHTFEMDYQSSVDLDKRLYGTYIGPLSRVVTRILQGYNFVLKTDSGSIVVTVVGTPSAHAANPITSNVAAANSAAPASPPSGDPRAPAPQPGQSGDPVPIPRASGSKATPAPEPGSPKDMPAPVAGPKPASARPRAL